MARQIWVGPVLSNNRERIVERCAGLISEGRADSVLYLTASYPLLELVTSGLLDGERNRGVWGSLPVHLFRGFVRHLLATAIEEESGLPLLPRIPIDREDLPLKRSLLAQILRGLARAGKLNALAPLAHSEGCVNSVASLIGEMQRAAKTPAEFEAIVRSRARDLNEPVANGDATIPRQIDFDRELSLIYAVYSNALDRFHLTEDDADQLRALSVLRGEVEGKRVKLPWLEHVRLLVLDGFFDFTPIQGEILRLLIPQVPEAIVNLNGDQRNPEIFRPYESTIRQLGSMADFELCTTVEEQPVAGVLSKLRARLFNPFAEVREGEEASALEQAPEAASETEPEEPNIRLFECGDRETEIRTIAKEIKRLALVGGYRLSEIALVVRQRAAYSDAIARIFEDEAIPCAIERRSALVEVPAVRAAAKLFQLLREMGDAGSAKIGDLADLLKSGYFRPAEADVAALYARFKREREQLLIRARKDGVKEPAVWDVDELENAIAFVGGEMRVVDWLSRARRLAGRTGRPADAELVDDDETEDNSLVSVDVESENISDAPDIEQPGSEVKPRLAREVHPAVIAWAATLIQYINSLIGQMPMDGRPADLRHSLLLLLERLQFASQIKSRSLSSEEELTRATLDLRGLEGMRRAFIAAMRSFEIAEGVMGDWTTSTEGVEAASRLIKLASLIDEVMRSLRGQGEAIGMSGGDRDGLQVLEATDVRGLQFRAIFIAGLIEGGFPLRTPRDWIYPHEERERLSAYGLTLEDISPATLLKEEHYFYQASCRATERLYVSRPLMLEGDTETVASYYIEELKQAAAPFEIAAEILRRDFDGLELFRASTSSEIVVALVRQSERHRHASQGGNLLPLPYIEQAISWASEKEYLSWWASDRINIERERAGKRFTEFDGEITNRDLIGMLYKQFGEGHVFSASELSLYGKCPFKFYAERILRLDPRGEAALDLKALDAGRLLHEVLRRFFERHRSQQLKSLDREELRAELQQVADRVFDEHERAVPPLNPQVWRIDREIRKILLDQVLIYELSLQENANGAKTMRPTFFELGFGMKDDEGDPNSKRKYLERTHPEGQTVLLRGRIDRVDIAPDGTVIAYDYKLSKGANVTDMREGRDLQIGIYLTALEQLFLRGHPIAGGGFYVLRGKQDRRNRGLYRMSFNDYTKLSGSIAATLTDDEWQQVRREMEARMWEFIDGMKVGSFRVKPSAPKDTCPRCDFSSVCRYETFRIRGKE
ncbi:MAG TPA: PD-(D/E)XK nuclease family protein [Blastocatellia bacterium]|nr:PD-(D/E)XK nuclease family protein [Blastocatellia bacterium]